jgi:ElaB/YqjD/DUF883 family membrane-anchored ribosome-binding protein
MSQTSSGVVDDTVKKASKEIEPLVEYVRENPVCTALVALALGFLLGKII